MISVKRIAGSLLIVAALSLAFLVCVAWYMEFWQWFNGYQEYSSAVEFIELCLWVLLFLGLGLKLVKAAGQRESQQITLRGPGNIDPSAGYLLRHWYGEHSLAQSFFVNTVLCSLAFYGGWQLLHNYSKELGIATYEMPVLHKVMFAFMYWGAFLGLIVWQLIGLLRAAERRINPRSSFWSWDSGRAVRLLAGVLFVATLYPLGFHALPEVYEGVMTILDDIADDKYTLHLRNDGTELEIRGHMTFGLTAEVEKHLATNPRIKVIHLNSLGGKALEGEGLYNLIRQRQLITYSSIECSSACTIAFIGGRKRYLNKHALLGFHESWTHSGLDLGIDNSEKENLYNAIKATTRREHLYYVEAGTDRNFAKKLFSSLTVYEVIHPSPEELLRAGVVHGVIETANLSLSE